MMVSSKIHPTHLQRRAYVYLRQSTARQVQHHSESAVNQRAMQERLVALGWKPDQITTIDSDLGCSGTEATARVGFQFLVTEVSLGRVGVVMGFDVSRLARSCKDWYHLIEICSLFDTLIADTDGVYHPSDFNDRLLLGLKGTMSEAELHSLRMRMDAGRLSKAKRGELVQHVPSGYVRIPDEGVVFDPDAQVQAAIRMVFDKFDELGSIRKVMVYFVRHDLKLPRRQTSGLQAGEVLWKAASSAAISSILANPAYAGAFAYGRRRVDPRRKVPGQPSTGRLRRERDQWLSLIQGVYPAYIDWKTYEDNQRRIAANRQRYDEQLRQRGAERQGRALLQGLVACRRCGRQMGVRYREKGNFEYRCAAMHSAYGLKPCQYITGRTVDDVVVREFLAVLSESEIDGLVRVEEKRGVEERRLIAHLEREVARCEYQARLAEKQYNAVDADNRLVAASLEKKWEQKLVELQAAREQLEDAHRTAGDRRGRSLPTGLRQAFLSVGKGLPALWPKLSHARRKELLRTLIRQVHLAKRDGEGEAELRIVWIGDHVTELVVGVPTLTRKESAVEAHILDRVRQLIGEGLNDRQIADVLNQDGVRTCRQMSYSVQTVRNLRLRHGILSRLEEVRRGGIPGYYTLPEIAPKIRVHPTWIYRLIARGAIRIEKHPTYGCYLFEKASRPVEKLRALVRGEIKQVSFKKGASRWLS
jgi:DNA invertase Pin-like site-specific DNA recombinase